MMRTASAKTQILAATQSVTLANQLCWEDLILPGDRNTRS